MSEVKTGDWPLGPPEGLVISQFTKDVLAGSVAGVTGTLIGHPLDTVKARLQTQTHYRGMFHCSAEVFKNEGFFNGFYRGLMPPMIQLIFMNAMSFGLFSQCKIAVQKVLPASVYDTSAAASHSVLSLVDIRYFMAGALTGAMGGVVSTPFEFVKVQMQLDNVMYKRFRGSIHCAKVLVHDYNFRILYTGFWINTWRETVFCAVYFGIYENLKRNLSRFFHRLNASSSSSSSSSSSLPPTPTLRPSELSITALLFNYDSLAIMLAGGLSGTAAWFVSYPLDSIKSNIQGLDTRPKSTTSPTSSSSSSSSAGSKLAIPRMTAKEAVRQIWSTRGFGGFYSGVLPSIARAFVVSSTRFSSYEFVVALLSHWER